MRVSFIVFSILGVIAYSSATALESRDRHRGGGNGGGDSGGGGGGGSGSRGGHGGGGIGGSHGGGDSYCPPMTPTGACLTSTTDYGCLCSNSGWSDNTRRCFKSNCHGSDYRQAKDFIYSSCKKAGHSLSGW
ncbi:hypothetical protein BDZ97DRAFT_2054819 [Flammula alnicola]|nr:hypothetical protein BDZ97DRAFT_2054819 [Flammula alnicola]